MPESEQYVQTRWVNATARRGLGDGVGSSKPGKVRAEVLRKANASLTEQLVAAEHFAQVMRTRRPVAEDGKKLTTLITGATDSVVKAEKSAAAREKRKVVLEKLVKMK